jgi:hypothetical protein
MEIPVFVVNAREELEADTTFSRDKLFSYYTYDCLLDTLHDPIRQQHDIGILVSSPLIVPTHTLQASQEQEAFQKMLLLPLFPLRSLHLTARRCPPPLI